MKKAQESIESISEIIERRKALQRSDSFTTVSSSKAEAFIRQQYEDIEKLAAFSENTITSDPKSCSKSEKDGVHFGDVIYVNYIMPSDSSNKNCNECSHRQPENNNLPVPRDLESNNPQNLVNTKKCFFTYIVTFIALVIVGGLIATVLLSKGSNQNDKENPNQCSEILCSSSRLHKNSTESKISEVKESTTSGSAESIFSSHDFYVPRVEWDHKFKRISDNSGPVKPVKRIILGHTAGNTCINKIHCIQLLDTINSQNSNLEEMLFNFYIGGDGMIYEGRGFNFESQHSVNSDVQEDKSIEFDIVFIGNLQNSPLKQLQMDALERFLKISVEHGFIVKDYEIIMQEDLLNNAYLKQQLVNF